MYMNGKTKSGIKKLTKKYRYFTKSPAFLLSLISDLINNSKQSKTIMKQDLKDKFLNFNDLLFGNPSLTL